MTPRSLPSPRGGPRTPAGKRRSSLNALKHGLRSNLALLPSEDEGEYLTFARAIVADLGAAGAVEMMLAADVVAAHWRIRRLRRYEAVRAALELRRADEPAAKARRAEDLIQVYARYAASLDAIVDREQPLPRSGIARRNAAIDAWRAACFSQTYYMVAFEGGRSIIRDATKARSRHDVEKLLSEAYELLRQINPDVPRGWYEFFKGAKQLYDKGVREKHNEFDAAVTERGGFEAVALLPADSLDLRDGGGLRADRVERRLMGELDRALRAFREHRSWNTRNRPAVTGGS